MLIRISNKANKLFVQKRVLLALEDAGVFTSGGLVKDKVHKFVLVLIFIVLKQFWWSYFLISELLKVQNSATIEIRMAAMLGNI